LGELENEFVSMLTWKSKFTKRMHSIRDLRKKQTGLEGKTGLG